MISLRKCISLAILVALVLLWVMATQLLDAVYFLNCPVQPELFADRGRGVWWVSPMPDLKCWLESH